MTYHFELTSVYAIGSRREFNYYESQEIRFRSLIFWLYIPN